MSNSGHVMNEEECLDHNSKEFIKLLNKYDKQIKYLSNLCNVLGFNETIKSDIMLVRQGLFDAEMDLTYPNPDDEERDDIRKRNMSNMQTTVNDNLQVAMGMINNMMEVRNMVNNYPHQQEMDEILQDLKDYTNSSKGKYGMTPFEVIRSFKHDMNIVMENGSYSENNESYFALSNLEEAAVLKNFGLWFQQEYKDMFNK